MATTARGIVYPVVGTTLTPLANHFAALASSANTALDNLAVYERGLDAAKGAAGNEGRTYYSTDTNRWWFDDGSNWISNDVGSYLIRPTSVVNGTITADGAIEPAGGSTTLSVNGVFTSRFRRYRVEYNYQPAGSITVFAMLFRRAGVDVNTGYQTQRNYAAGAAMAAANASTGNIDFIPISCTHVTGHIDLTNPAFSSSTGKAWTGESFFYSGGSTAGMMNYGGVNGNVAATPAFDGFTIVSAGQSLPSGGTTFFKVYGLA